MHFADAAQILAGLFPVTDARFRACVRKRAYAMYEEVLAVKEKREQLTGLTLHVYRCEHAGDADVHWHLSSHPMTDAQQTRLEARAHAYVREVMADCAALVKTSWLLSSFGEKGWFGGLARFAWSQEGRENRAVTERKFVHIPREGSRPLHFTKCGQEPGLLCKAIPHS